MSVSRDAAGYATGSHKWYVLGVVVLGSFMSILDATVVNIALPKLISVYSTDVHGAQWVLTSYLLALAIVIPLTGYLDETFGGKRVYILTVALFTLASMLCGVAWSLTSLIFFRVLQGLGGGLIQPLGMSLLLREFRPEERGTAFGLFGIPLMLGPALGPTLGGYLVEYVDWRFIFYINVPIGIIAVLAASRYLIELPRRAGETLDVWGIALVSIGSAALLLGVDNGPTEGWGSFWVLTEVIIGVVALAAFIIVELRVAQPLLELRLFRSFAFTSAVAVTLIVQIALFGAIFLLPVYLQNLRGLGAMETGIMMVPQALTVAVVMPISGRLFDKVGPRLLLFPGLVLLTYATYRFKTLSMDTSNAEIIGNLVLRGVGMGMVMMPATTAAMNAVPRDLLPRATALTNALQRIAGSFGTAVMATILTARESFHFATIAQTVTPDSLGVQAAMSGIQTLLAQNSLPEALAHQLGVLLLYQEVVLTSTIRAFDDTFLVSAVVCIPAILASLLIRNEINAESGRGAMVLGE